MVVCLGDSNVVSGTTIDFPSVVGPHGSRVMNDNLDRFVNFRHSTSLQIAGSFFCHKYRVGQKNDLFQR